MVLISEAAAATHSSKKFKFTSDKMLTLQSKHLAIMFKFL